jgi:hypothetical protein
MPYKLRKAPNRNLYWVVTIETKKKHSKDPIPLEKAKAQMRILESALVGGGFWEQQFINHVRREISDVNQTLFAQIQTDLKHRLAQQFKTFGGFIPFSNKQKLVDEAVNTLKRLNNSLKEQTTTTNPLHSEQAPQTATELYESQGKVTGPVGNRPIIRENPPQFSSMTTMQTLPANVYNVDYNPSFKPNDQKEYFKSIYINSFDTKKGMLQWGKFNTIYIIVYDPEGNGHVGALIRRLTEPFSYIFYDPHGKSWNNPTSLFFSYRTKLNSIVDGHNVDFNSFPHQCALPLCAMYSAARATFPHLSNIEYDNIIINTITRVAEGEIEHIDRPGQPSLVLPIYDINARKTRRIYTPPSIEKERQIYEHFRNPLNRSFPLGNGLFLMKGDVVGHIIYAKTKQILMRNPPNERLGFGKRKLIGGGIFKTELWNRLAQFPPSIRETIYKRYEPQLDQIKSGTNYWKGRFFSDEAKREQKRNIIEAAIADAKEVYDKEERERAIRDQVDYRRLPYRKVPPGTQDPITLNTLGKHGDPISTITENAGQQGPRTFFFQTPSLEAWEQQSLLQGRQPSNPLTNLPYNPEQRRNYKAQDPTRKPVQEIVEYQGLKFPRIRPPGRGQFESAPPPSPANEPEGEGRHRGKRKCKKCGKKKIA